MKVMASVEQLSKSIETSIYSMKSVHGGPRDFKAKPTHYLRFANFPQPICNLQCTVMSGIRVKQVK